MSATYQTLNRAGVPSLYAVTSLDEEIAKSFATYVHVVLMRKPWQIQILQDNQIIFCFADYWTSPRAQRKAQIFAEFLHSPT